MFTEFISAPKFEKRKPRLFRADRRVRRTDGNAGATNSSVEVSFRERREGDWGIRAPPLRPSPLHASHQRERVAAGISGKMTTTTAMLLLIVFALLKIEVA